MGGMQPVWFHGVNTVLHATCCVLLTRVALVVASLDTRFATIAGMLFAAHPIHTEAVAGVVGRADVLACLLFLLSFLTYHDEGWRLTKGSRLLCSCLLAALSMLAKETGITVLIVNLLYDLYKNWPHVKRVIVEVRWNEESLQFARRTAKILMATSMLLAFRLAMLQGSLPKFSSQDNPAAFHPCPHVREEQKDRSQTAHPRGNDHSQVTSLLTFCYLAAFNWWLLLCPSTLSHDWQMGSIPLVTSLADCRNLTTALFVTCCLVLAYRCAAEFELQRQAPLVLGSLLLAVPFLPATNIIFTVGFVVAERVLYIPSLGAVLLVAYGAQILHKSSCWTPRSRSAILTCLLLILASFSFKTLDRNRDWSTREALIRAGIKTLPHNAKMHYNLANYLRDTNSADLAITHYREALRLWPGYASAHNNLGTLMSSASEAEAHFRSAITISPSHVNAHYNLGQVYRKMNRTLEAVTMLERCLRLDTSYTPAYLVLAKLHSPPVAARLLYHVTRLLPNSPDYQAYFASWLHDRGVTRLALKFYLRALGLQNDHLASTLGVARCLRAQGQIARLHQFLIRWYLMHRGHSGRGRLVYVAELYVRTLDLYKPSQSTYSHPPTVECGTRDTNRSRWWRSVGMINHTKNSCRNQKANQNEQEAYMEGDAQRLDPSRICLDQTGQSTRPCS
ncbi:hypothetical protein J6590_070707 [Homalodisca vitripennis]|nr:hypothetical protein J6590_070707 [Homalodisca vitripennis]